MCTYCNNTGLWPFCPKCLKPFDYQPPKKTKSKPKVDYAQKNKDSIEEYRINLNEKELDKMKTNIEKVNGDSSGVDYLLQNNN